MAEAVKAEWRDRSNGFLNVGLWELKLGSLRLAAHQYYKSDGSWYSTCKPFFQDVPLQATDLDAAKAEALSLVRARLTEALEALPDE